VDVALAADFEVYFAARVEREAGVFDEVLDDRGDEDIARRLLTRALLTGGGSALSAFSRLETGAHQRERAC